MPSFRFEPTSVVFVDCEYDPGAFSIDEARQVANLPHYYPELAHWREGSLDVAWGDFSQSIYAVGWLFENQQQELRNPMFLAYLYVRQLRPSFKFDSTGLCFMDIQRLAALEPWLLEGDHAPLWAGSK